MRKLILIISAGLFFFVSCKSLKDSSLARVYHNITSHYNIYFNANEILKEIITDTEESHVDDYNDVLSILRQGNETNLKGNASSCDIILKKCTKIFDKHKDSKWVDDTYLLAGKAYFYKADFFAAIDAFQYVKSTYKNTDLAYEAILWTAYCYLQLDKEKDAQAIITLLKSDKKFPTELKKELLLADAHIDILFDDYMSAVASLKKAIEKERNRNYKTRYLFIYAQLLQRLNELEKASEIYQQVIKRNPEYTMAFNAKIEVAHCINISDTRSAQKIRSILVAMLKDDKNLQYLDQIYYEIALIDLSTGQEKEAEKNLKLSVLNSKSNDNQKALSYLKLAGYYFDIPEYQLSKAYFDSTQMFLSPSFSGYEEITNKNKVLGALVKHYVTIEESDSLLLLANATPKVRDSIIFKAWQEEQRILREQQEKEKEKKLREEQEMSMSRNQVRNNRMMMPPGMGNTSLAGGSEWYFYNQNMIKLGEAEFKVKFGTRKLVDNWRVKSLMSIIDESAPTLNDSNNTEDVPIVYEMTEKEVKERNELLKDIPKERLKYYENIPFTESEQKTMHVKVMMALKKIAEISLEEINDTATAIWAYDQLARRYPGEKYNALAHYTLYKLLDPVKKADERNAHKDTILQHYPNSDYAILITNPDHFRKQREEQKVEIEGLYVQAYQYYETGNCEKLKDLIKESNNKYPNNYKQDNFEYLYLLCKGKNAEKDEFVADLSNFIKTTSNEELINHAQIIIDYYNAPEESETSGKEVEKVDSFLLKSVFKTDETGPFQFLFVFETRKVNSTQLKTSFSDYNAKYYSLDELKITTFIYDKDLQILVVKDFDDKFKAVKYRQNMLADNEFLTTIKNRKPEFMTISQNNFNILLKNQNLPEYREFYKRYLQK